MRIDRLLALQGPHKEDFARSYGGFTSKIQTLTDGQGRTLGFVPTGGEVSDYKAFEPLLNLPTPKPRLFLTDKRYDDDIVREALLMKGIVLVIPPKANRKISLSYNKQIY